jgi:hypothetical protein
MDASYSLSELDAAVVQSAVSVSQSSAEQWYDNNYAEMASVAADASTELADGRTKGTIQSYSSEGMTWICQGGVWNPARGPGRHLTAPRFLLAANAAPIVACPSKRALYLGIFFADAAGAVIGGIQGAPGGAIGVGIGAIYRGAQFSGGGAWTALGINLFCNIF